MAVNIGPKIGLDGEKEYRSALNNIIQQQKTLNSEMKKISSAYDTNGSKIKKNRELHEQLGKAVENQKKRVEMLKAGLADYEQKTGSSSTETLKMKQALADAEAELNKLQSDFRDTGPLKTWGAALSETGDKVKQVGDSLTKNVTVPIMGLGASSMAAWKQMDAGMDIVIKKTGATGEQLDGLEQIVKNLGKSVPTSFTNIGEAVGEVNTRFGVTGDELEDLSAKFIKFAEINDVDITSSVDGVQKAMAAFGLESQDAGHMLDLLTATSQKTGVSVSDLVSGLIQNAAAFQEMGLSADQAVVLMGQMEMSGADSTAIMSALRKELKNAAKDGTDMNTALAELQNEILNGTDSMDGLNKAYELFGKNGDQVYNAVKNGSLDFRELGASAVDCGGLVEQTFDATKSPAEQFQTALNQLIELGYEIANAIMPSIQSGLETVIPIVESATEWWNSLDESQQDFIVKAALVVAAIGPVVTGIGNVISIGGTLLSVLGTVVSTLGGPVTLAIGAVVAAGVLLFKNWDTIKKKAGELWKNIQTTFDNIKKSISEKIEGAKEAVRKAIDAIKGFFNFNWKLPKLKMPHFRVSGSANPLDWFSQGVPKISVDWYAKAMPSGMILNNPTIFGMNNGKFLGGGEAGPEAVIGVGSLQSIIRAAVISGVKTVMPAMTVAPIIYQTNGDNVFNIYAAPNHDTKAIADEVSNIVVKQIRKERMVFE